MGVPAGHLMVNDGVGGQMDGGVDPNYVAPGSAAAATTAAVTPSVLPATPTALSNTANLKTQSQVTNNPLGAALSAGANTPAAKKTALGT